jgi:hypothetical protein
METTDLKSFFTAIIMGVIHIATESIDDQIKNRGLDIAELRQSSELLSIKKTMKILGL